MGGIDPGAYPRMERHSEGDARRNARRGRLRWIATCVCL